MRLAKRGDIFYYVEVWGLSEYRNKIISNLLDINNNDVSYLSGSTRSLTKVNKIEFATFWKNKHSAESRIEYFEKRPKDEYKYVIKSISREEFINLIPDKEPNCNKYQKMCWLKNKETKQKEVTYKRKLRSLENPYQKDE